MRTESIQKRIISCRVVIVILSILGIVFFVGQSGIAKETYTLGFKLDFTLDYEAQAKLFAEEVTNTINAISEFNLDFAFLSSEEELWSSVEKGSLDIVYVSDVFLFYLLLKTHIFEPLVAIEFNTRLSYDLCFFLKNFDSHDISGLRGSSLGIDKSFLSYCLLRNLVVEKPEEFFKTIVMTPDSHSVFYLLAMNEVDTVFAAKSIPVFYSFSNPGVTKDIKEIVCSGFEFIQPAILYREKADSEFVKSLKSIFLNLHSNPEFRKYSSLFKITKSRFVEVSLDDYKPFLLLFDEAIKKGWDRDFEKFVKSAKLEQMK